MNFSFLLKIVLIIAFGCLLAVKAATLYTSLAKKRRFANVDFKEGDIIFQTSLSGQSKAIQIATNSKYSHCGVILKRGKSLVVFEAIQPTTFTPITKWIARGKSNKYVVKRLLKADKLLTPLALKKIHFQADKFNGKKYDLEFGWSDEKMYCSELIWKIYYRAIGVRVGQLEKLSSFNLENDIVKAKLKERYGNKIPLNEVVISPDAIFESDLLYTVYAN